MNKVFFLGAFSLFFFFISIKVYLHIQAKATVVKSLEMAISTSKRIGSCGGKWEEVGGKGGTGREMEDDYI